MFAYCENNPVNRVDYSGNFWEWYENAFDWFNDNVIQPVANFVSDVKEDVKNFDINNQDETKATESHYFSAYKGIMVFKTDLVERSFTFGAIVLSNSFGGEECHEDVLRHEYGHTKQKEQLGVLKYITDIAIPSIIDYGSGQYYDKPWEVTADVLGGVKSRHAPKERVAAGFSYLERRRLKGPFVWLSSE